MTFNMFPDEDRFVPLFRRLLPIGAVVAIPSCILFGLVAWLGEKPVDLFGITVSGFWAFAFFLLMIPVQMAGIAFTGAFHLYFGRRIPGVRRCFPRVLDKKDK